MNLICFMGLILLQIQIPSLQLLCQALFMSRIELLCIQLKVKKQNTYLVRINFSSTNMAFETNL